MRKLEKGELHILIDVLTAYQDRYDLSGMQSFRARRLVEMFEQELLTFPSPSEPFKHTDECEQAEAQHWIRRRVWWIAHPNACKFCEGAGEMHVPDTYDTPGFSDLCTCVEEGVCALCGAREALDLDDEDYPTCRVCGWTGKRAGDVCPAAYDYCQCFELQYQEED